MDVLPLERWWILGPVKKAKCFFLVPIFRPIRNQLFLPAIVPIRFKRSSNCFIFLSLFWTIFVVHFTPFETCFIYENSWLHGAKRWSVWRGSKLTGVLSTMDYVLVGTNYENWGHTADMVNWTEMWCLLMHAMQVVRFVTAMLMVYDRNYSRLKCPVVELMRCVRLLFAFYEWVVRLNSDDELQSRSFGASDAKFCNILSNVIDRG